MEPFDFKALTDKLVAQGLPVVEDLAEKAATAVFEWTEESILAHPNALVKAIGIPAVQILKPLAFKAIDQIDGKDDDGDGSPAAAE